MSNLYNCNLINQYAKYAYRHSSEEDYLLSFMTDYANEYNKEADDEVLITAYNVAEDHKGNKMKWYKKALLNNDVIIQVGDEVTVKSKDEKSDILTKVVSINDYGFYMQASNSKEVFYGYLSNDGSIHYDIINQQPKKSISHNQGSYYIVPQFSDRDLGYKEAVKSNNIEAIKKRASYILDGLDRLFPEAVWSIRIVNKSGEDVEVVEL